MHAPSHGIPVFSTTII